MTTKTPPLVFAGVATHDTVALVDRYPGPDERVHATRLVQAGGGPAATAAVTAARLGHDVAFVGTVGDDEQGRWIRADLTANGIDVSGLVSVEGAHSAASVVIVDSNRSTRAIVNRPPPAIRLSPRALELLTSAAWVHVDQTGWGPVHNWWLTHSDRPRLSVDAGNPIDGFTPADVDLYVPTVGALRRTYGSLERADLLRCALDAGPHLVVATDGADGAFALGIGQPLVSAPGIAGPVLSTLGAGDVFHGALLAGLHRGMALEDCLQYANRVAYLSCQGLDGRSAIPTHDEVVLVGAT